MIKSHGPFLKGSRPRNLPLYLLALPLFVLGVFANNHHAAFALDDLAFFAYRFY
jgi:hypothetical protein